MTVTLTLTAADGATHQVALAAPTVVSTSSLFAPIITSLRPVSSTNPLFKVVAGGSTMSNNLLAVGTGVAGASVTVGGVAATVDTNGNWSAPLGLLADGAHTITATQSLGGQTSAPSASFAFTVKPGLGSLPVAVGSNIYVGGALTWSGVNFVTQSDSSSNNPNCCVVANTHELDFTSLPGDVWNGTNRTEICENSTHPDGTTFNISYEILLSSSSPVNDDFGGGKWFLIGQLHHNSSSGSPPFDINLGGDVTHSGQTGDMLNVDYGHGGSFSNLYKASSNLTRGVWHSVDIVLRPENSSSGLIQVWLDGVEIVNHNGAFYDSSGAYYWKLGIYRGASSSQTQIVRYRNLLYVCT